VASRGKAQREAVLFVGFAGKAFRAVALFGGFVGEARRRVAGFMSFAGQARRLAAPFRGFAGQSRRVAAGGLLLKGAWRKARREIALLGGLPGRFFTFFAEGGLTRFVGSGIIEIVAFGAFFAIYTTGLTYISSYVKLRLNWLENVLTKKDN